jgi:Right handed beta helix region
VFSGNGVTITGVGSRVRLSGITINGKGGDIGIHFQQGSKLAVDHCTMSDLNFYGLYVQAANSTWIVTDTTVNGNAIYGIIAEAGTGSIDRVRVENNFGVGILVNTTSNVLVRALVRNTVASGNAGHGFSVFTGSGRTAIVTIENSSAFLNGDSGFSGATSGGTTLLTLRFVDATANANSGAIATGTGATVGITGSTLVRNTNFGMEQTTGSILRSLQNNTVEDNVAGATSGTITNSLPI